MIFTSTPTHTVFTPTLVRPNSAGGTDVSHNPVNLPGVYNGNRRDAPFVFEGRSWRKFWAHFNSPVNMIDLTAINDSRDTNMDWWFQQDNTAYHCDWTNTLLDYFPSGQVLTRRFYLPEPMVGQVNSFSYGGGGRFVWLEVEGWLLN